MQGPAPRTPSPLPDAGPRHSRNTHKENKMDFDYLRRLLTSPLDQRVTDERRTMAYSTTGPSDSDAYFKEVFAGQIL